MKNHRCLAFHVKNNIVVFVFFFLNFFPERLVVTTFEIKLFLNCRRFFLSVKTTNIHFLLCFENGGKQNNDNQAETCFKSILSALPMQKKKKKGTERLPRRINTALLNLVPVNLHVRVLNSILSGDGGWQICSSFSFFELLLNY